LLKAIYASSLSRLRLAGVPGVVGIFHVLSISQWPAASDSSEDLSTRCNLGPAIALQSGYEEQVEGYAKYMVSVVYVQWGTSLKLASSLTVTFAITVQR
jgi:hypothetical protein